MWKAKRLTENKTLEVQLDYFKPNFFYKIFDKSTIIWDDSHYFMIYFMLFGDLFNFDIQWTRKSDHAGFRFNINILGLFFEFSVVDNRHWDDDTDDYCVYGTECSTYTEEQKQEMRDTYQKIIDKSKDIK